jgi:predicted membrane metal-binding protein
MECLQLLPGPEGPQFCDLLSRFAAIGAWGEANASWLVAALGGLVLFFVLWSSQRAAPLAQQSTTQTPKERAEGLLQDSVTQQQYQYLLNFGYLEIPSRLYSNRYYRIPRERRRVQVYEVCETNMGLQHQKLGELCVIACEPMPDADLVLTHKWLIEADEQKYLNTANWVR